MLHQKMRDLMDRARPFIPFILWQLIVLACCYRVWVVYAYNPMDHIWSDPERHWVQGIDAKRDDPLAMMDPILFQLYIGIFAKLTLGIHKLTAFYTAALSLLTPWLWYRFLRELQPSRNLALLGWAILAWSPSWTAIYSYFMQETLMLPLLGAALWATWRCRRKATLQAFLAAAILWTLAGLTRSICLPLGLLALVWLWIAQGDKVRRAATSLLLLALVFGPLTVRSLERAHLVAPHGIGGLNALYARSGGFEINIEFKREGAGWGFGFGSPSVGTEPFAPYSDWRTKREGVAKFKIDMDKGAEDWDAEQAKINLDLPRYLWLTGENLAFLFFAESWPDTDRSRSIGEINYRLRWLWAPLSLAGLALTVGLWRRQRERLLPSLILVWFLLQGLGLVAVNEGRYRKPFEGLLIAQLILLASTLRKPQQAAATPTAPQGAGQ
ncbi:hypothetical protein GCM10027046_35690 [Uliginosibacterium flavum]|uniref:Glycosyltransferase family 39 protein n=1 Tax=Uliginosibacterium flavum TaxID=1396831 RepID=A0ABV2TPL4_9RHOO